MQAFRRSCARDLRKLCPEITTKNEAVVCLSEQIRNATLLDKQVPLTQDCYHQVRSENLYKSQVSAEILSLRIDIIFFWESLIKTVLWEYPS